MTKEEKKNKAAELAHMLSLSIGDSKELAGYIINYLKTKYDIKV